MLNEADTSLAVLGKDPKESTRTHFSVFYSHQAISPIKTGSHQLPLIPEPVTAPAAVRHAVNIVHKITQNVSPGQISIITGNRPVYAIQKHLQWMFPTEVKDIVWILGPFHIKQATIKLIGDWPENSGWTDVYDNTNISPQWTHLATLRGFIHQEVTTKVTH